MLVQTAWNRAIEFDLQRLLPEIARSVQSNQMQTQLSKFLVKC